MINFLVQMINKIDAKVFEKVEWVTLNLTTGLMFVLDNYFGTIMTAIGVLSLAFFNIMRGIKIYKEFKNKKDGKL